MKKTRIAMVIEIQELIIYGFRISQRTDFVSSGITTDEFNLYGDPLTPKILNPIFSIPQST